ncbi:uncharacterized protein OCT59_019524 [Rhizophagus irregularis]|uniref:uncharacterized protein n=1 Tax=Rhizophagus irregularis TaxID=588596 RepID=UPI001A058F40|nr:hypothetical protein OCT59_019524 [Rhizophagus irregularis]GET56066.1 hypothetical protein RIR_jg26195.t1 [Rhizophagus irregularis DAOM 181602=DAOM 197198]
MICMCSSAGWEGKCLLIFESGSSSTPPSSSLILTLIFVLTRSSFSFSSSREMSTFHNLSIFVRVFTYDQTTESDSRHRNIWFE